MIEKIVVRFQIFNSNTMLMQMIGKWYVFIYLSTATRNEIMNNKQFFKNESTVNY